MHEKKRKERFTSEVRFAAPHTQSSVRRVSINLFFFSLIFVLNLRHGLRKKGMTARSVLSLSPIL